MVAMERGCSWTSDLREVLEKAAKIRSGIIYTSEFILLDQIKDVF
jgi:hypothetical protein